MLCILYKLTRVYTNRCELKRFNRKSFSRRTKYKYKYLTSGDLFRTHLTLEVLEKITFITCTVRFYII